jgi:Kef-type K+ transport system membrane component KefB
VSGHGGAPKQLGTRFIQALALATIFALLFAVRRFTPSLREELGTVAAIGLLLLAGTLLSELLEPFGLPHLSGYLAAGILGGPHVLHLVDHETVDHLTPVNTIALSLIALAGGAELRTETLRKVARSLGWATLTQSTIVLVVMGGVFLALSGFIPFVAPLPVGARLAAAMLWGVLCVTRSPSACLGILSQTRARGPIATFSLAFIMTSDVVVIVLVALAMMIARPLLTPGAEFSLHDFQHLWDELAGSIAIGTTLGLALAAYLRLLGGRALLLILLAIGFALSPFLRYVRADPLLAFITAGFVVQNLTNQGPKLLHAVEQTGSVVFVVFFATAGAHLNVPLLKEMWQIALALCGARAFATFVAARIASRLADDPPALRTWGFSSLVSQAGLALGLAGVISGAFPSIGAGFQALAIAAVAINEMTGPILFKFALDRAGETHREEAEVARTSLVPPAPVG